MPRYALFSGPSIANPMDDSQDPVAVVVCTQWPAATRSRVHLALDALQAAADSNER